MALSNLALAATAIAGGLTLVVVASKKKKRAAKRTVDVTPVVFGGGGAKLPTPDHPICKKYPGGFWAPGGLELKGYPADKPGWSASDMQMVTAAVEAEVANAPAWTSMTDARELAFQMTRKLIAGWCPSMVPRLPPYREKVEDAISKSLAMRWLWQSVHSMIWQRLVGDVGGGN